MNEQQPSLINITVQLDDKAIAEAMSAGLTDAVKMRARCRDEVTLENLRPGAIFVTQDGVYAVKTEYRYPDGECECILLESGEYAHFPDYYYMLVREVRIGEL